MSEYYNDAVNEPYFNIKEDYKRWNTVGVFCSTVMTLRDQLVCLQCLPSEQYFPSWQHPLHVCI
jgi:hypothetical protein